MSDEFFRRVFGDREVTRIGSGWASGVASVFFGTLGLGAVFCLHFPSLLTFPEIRAIYPMAFMRGLIQGVIVAAFALGALSSLLRRRKVLGLTGMSLAALATLLGGASVAVEGPIARGPYIGFDWFLVNLFATVLIFFPIELFWPLHAGQGPFREEWTTDTAHFFANHAFVQVLSFLILLPATVASHWLTIPGLGAVVGAWPFAVQLFLAILVADLTQYTIHRIFHVVP